MFLFVLNLAMALLWLFLNNQPTLLGFLTGYTLGFGLLALFRPLLPNPSYVRRVLAFFRFLGIFLVDMTVANWQLLKAVLFGRRESLRPDLVTCDIGGLSPMEVLLLSHCLALTPGTTPVEVEEGGNRMIFHAFDARDPEELRAHIDRRLKSSILAFTR